MKFDIRETYPSFQSWGSNSWIILHGMWVVVTTIVFNPLLINLDNPKVDFFNNWKSMRMQEAFNDIPCIKMSSYTFVLKQSQDHNPIIIIISQI